MSHHLAQLNVGRIRAPLDHPDVAEFVDALDHVNALAEAAPGFVWRLTDDDGQSSSYVEIPGNDDPSLIVNLSVWTDLASLRDFMYRTDHVTYLRRRNEWFEPSDEVTSCAWWLPVGERPTVADAHRRLQHLRAHGPTDVAWPLTRPREAPGTFDRLG